MKSIRLNKSIRAEIVSNIMQSYSNENVRPVEPASSTDALDLAIHDWLLSKYAKELKQFNKLKLSHPNAVSSTNSFGYRDVNENTCYVHFSTKNRSSYVDEVYQPSVYVPHIWDGYVIDLSNPDTVIPESIQQVLDEIYNKKKGVRQQRKLVDSYDREYEQYQQDVTQIVEGCNTSAQLLEVWEEVEEFLPKGVVNPSKINLPSVNIAALNRKLGV